MVAERIQRRLAAVLIADVVGYSRLMGEDEEGTHARLNKLRAKLLHPKISEYGGRIVKTTGDGTLIEFSSAVDAVQHAVDVQTLLAQRNASLSEGERIDFRMGINVGDIIVQDDDIFGDGVNVAARLEGISEPGGICVSGTVYDQVRGKLDLPFRDLGEQSLKNITEPVRVIAIQIDTVKNADETTAALNAIFRRPAVAVLPFQNMSGDPEQEFLADGLTEDIITALSNWRSFPVIARNSTFAYKGQSPDIRQVGEELGARYVIEGSVRKSGNRVRVSAQLINAGTGHHVWAERYDRELADIFDLQDELSQHIAATVAPELEFSQAAPTQTKKPQNLDAWELVQRGFGHVFAFDHRSIGEGREFLERAIRLDPDYANAYTGLAWSYHRELWLMPEKFSDEIMARFLDAAERAVSLDESDSSAHGILAMACIWANYLDRGLAEAERAVALNPNNAHAQEFLGTVLTLMGRPDEGLPHQERAFSLSPRDPRQGVWLWTRALTYLTARQYEEAVHWAQGGIQRHPANPEAHLVLASALGHLGRLDDARVALTAYTKLVPYKSVRPSLIWAYRHEDNDKHFQEGLRKAGLA